MKRLCLLCLTLPFFCFAQKRDTVLKYWDDALNFTSKKNAVYAGAAIRQQDQWYVFALYPDTSYLLKSYYKDKALTIKEGPYEIYYPKNIPAVAGYYHNNNTVGVWRTWYENGRLKDSGFLSFNIRMGVWKTWYPNGQAKEECVYKTDTTLQSFLSSQAIAFLNSKTGDIKQGPYKSWYQDGTLEAVGTFVNDSMDGEWRWYHENGKQSSIETYKAGKMISLACFDTTGNTLGILCSISKPPLLREYGDYNIYIQQNLFWPKEALKKGIEDHVRVTFRVTKQGSLDNLQIQTKEPVLKKAVEQFFATMTDWLPAVSHNRVIDSYQEITIPFLLE